MVGHELQCNRNRKRLRRCHRWARLAEAGARVLILERGRRGDKFTYPRSRNSLVWDNTSSSTRDGWLEIRRFLALCRFCRQRAWEAARWSMQTSHASLLQRLLKSAGPQQLRTQNFVHTTEKWPSS